MRDREVREAAWEVLRAQHVGVPDVLMLNELGLQHGAVRVDIAVVNGELCGYELKSERDTLTRLPKQVDAYNSVMDRAVLVCAEKHLKAARGILPRWWGLWRARAVGARVEVEVLREGQLNRHVQSIALARLLWRDEALTLLELLDAARGGRTKPRALIYEALAERMELPALRHAVRSKLKARTSWHQTAATDAPAEPPA